MADERRRFRGLTPVIRSRRTCAPFSSGDRTAPWHTVWSAIKPLLEAMAHDESRFDGVHTLGSMSTCGTTPRPSRPSWAAAVRRS